MAANSKIEWTHHTFNPWIGCTKVGPGCDHGYAEALMDTRYGRVNWGAGNPRSRTSEANWRKPLAWNKRCEKLGIRERVFCASLADVFDNEAPQEWREDLWDLIRATPNLDWLLLTKRIGNAPSMLPMVRIPNVWIGATVVNQQEAERDIPKLLILNAAVLFLSMEPLLGPVNLAGLRCAYFRGQQLGAPIVALKFGETFPLDAAPAGYFDALRGRSLARVEPDEGLADIGEQHSKIDWVIVGGESGPGARPMHPQWARNVRDQCLAAGVPFLFKQHGEWIGEEDLDSAALMAPQQSDPNDHLHRHDFPDGTRVWKAGKKAAGRTLDWQTWDQVPEAG